MLRKWMTLIKKMEIKTLEFEDYIDLYTSLATKIVPEATAFANL